MKLNDKQLKPGFSMCSSRHDNWRDNELAVNRKAFIAKALYI